MFGIKDLKTKIMTHRKTFDVAACRPSFVVLHDLSITPSSTI